MAQQVNDSELRLSWDDAGQTTGRGDSGRCLGKHEAPAKRSKQEVRNVIAKRLEEMLTCLFKLLP